MSIDVRKFVNIDIVHKEVSSVVSIRDTVVLLSNDATSETLSDLTAKAKTLHLVDESAVFDSIEALQLAMKITSLEQFNTLYNEWNSSTQSWDVNLTNATAYVTTYFANGGNKIIVVTNITDAKANIIAALAKLSNELIVVGYTGNQATFKTIAQEREVDPTIYGVNRKLLLMSTSTANDTDKVVGLIEQYTSNNEDVMSIAAYLSNIDVYGINTVQDYCFTRVTAKTIVDNDTTFDALKDNDINFVVKLSGNNVSYGGNCKDGSDLVNEFMLIVLQQTVTDRVLLALTSKLKNEAGLAVISAVISKELDYYVANGYLNRTAIWTDNDYTVEYNNQSFTVVEQNATLPLGYRIKILPYSSLTAADKLAHSTPPIYLAISDSYGIRKVTINGKVF